MPASPKEIAKDFCPPIFWRGLARAKRSFVSRTLRPVDDVQNPNVWSTPFMGELLERWGEGNCWVDIQLLMADLHGRVMDIACGTGRVMTILEKPGLEIYGCDILDLLINKATERGLPAERLSVCDATAMPYRDNEFDFSYSIGALDHFTEEGIEKFIAEAARITRVASFHMMRTSRSGRDDGWIKSIQGLNIQSFHNRSLSWWLPRFEGKFSRIRTVDSTWGDEISVGKWFLCYK